MPELTDRQRRYLVAAFKVAPREEDRFMAEQIRPEDDWTAAESVDCATVLEEPFNFVKRYPDLLAEAYAEALGREVPVAIRDGMPCRLTEPGREHARHLIEVARKAKGRYHVYLTSPEFIVGQVVYGIIMAAIGAWIGSKVGK